MYATHTLSSDLWRSATRSVEASRLTLKFALSSTDALWQDQGTVVALTAAPFSPQKLPVISVASCERRPVLPQMKGKHRLAFFMSNVPISPIFVFNHASVVALGIAIMSGPPFWS